MKKGFGMVLGMAMFTSMGSVANASQSDKVYTEVDYMRLDMNWKTTGADFSANPPALGLKLGVQLNESFEIEGLLGMGISSDSFANAGVAGLYGELNSLYGVNAQLIVAAADNAKIYGKLGFTKIDLNITGETFNNTGLSYGIGVAIDLIKNHALTVEYLVLPDVNISDSGVDLGKVKTTSLNVGFKYNF